MTVAGDFFLWFLAKPRSYIDENSILGAVDFFSALQVLLCRFCFAGFNLQSKKKYFFFGKKLSI
jgi:hypothetical protein